MMTLVLILSVWTLLGCLLFPIDELGFRRLNRKQYITIFLVVGPVVTLFYGVVVLFSKTREKIEETIWKLGDEE